MNRLPRDWNSVDDDGCIILLLVHEDLSTQPVCPSFLNYPQLSHTFICFSKFFTSVAWVNMVETCWKICGFMIASKHKGRVVWSTPTTVAHIMTWKTQSSAPDILISFASWFLRTLRSHVATKMIPLLDPEFVHHATGFKHKKRNMFVVSKPIWVINMSLHGGVDTIGYNWPKALLG